ncbi:MAG: MobA/MobL family protein [Ahrensia sp.]|nr:MobA/MobL family protein [Ahrensia sp.]
MADYRLSANIIKRSNGQSSVASAAYRSGTRLVDERTGEIHDYTRKQGVIHSEVMAPADATPEWMYDRAQLWNAIEAVERRKDAQLSREIQLSLPHELTDDQRRDLLRGFVQEQFVDRGMIADVAIHAPSDQGDQRNHHAHVMLTMRELTGEAFGKKSRDWNNPELLNEWREQWANHQNRALERHGHNSRVDHRSYEAQGIDREPQQHLGPVASDMERNGKPSRIGDENREIANDNFERVQNHLDAVNQAMESKTRVLDLIADIDRTEIENAQKLDVLALSQKHHRQMLRLEENLEKTYGTAKATIKAEVDSINQRLEAQGVRKILRDVFGRTRSDRSTRAEMTATLKGIEQREIEARGALERRQDAERNKQARIHNDRRNQLVEEKRKLRESGRGKVLDLKKARQERISEVQKSRPAPPKSKLASDWKKPETPAPKPPPTKPAAKAPEKTPEPKVTYTLKSEPFKLEPRPVPKSSPEPKPQPEAKSSNEPDLADRKRATGDKLDGMKEKAKRLWESNSQARPWESSLSNRPTRERKRGPDQPPKGGKK